MRKTRRDRTETVRFVACALISGTAFVLLAGLANAAEPFALFVEDSGVGESLYRQSVEPSEEAAFLFATSINPEGTDSGLFFATPDAQTVVFGSMSNFYLAVLSGPTDGGEDPTLLSSGQAVDAYLPSCNPLSPDGERVLFFEESNGYFQAFVAAIDGAGDPVLVSSAAPSGDASSPFHESPVCPSFFTPDGSRVLFLEDDGNDVRLYSRASDGSGDPVLLSNEGEIFGDVKEDVAPSPDGTRVAYRIRESFAQTRLYSRAIDGSEEPRLLSNQEAAGDATVKRGPIYGPNSQYVVFVEEPGEGDNELFSRRDHDDSVPQRLSGPGVSARLAEGNPISASQNAVVFQAERQLYQQSLDANEGEPAVQLSRGDPWAVRGIVVALSPDGETAVYVADENFGNDQVFSVAVAGDGEPVLLSSADLDGDATLIGWSKETGATISPDGVTAVFRQDFGPATKQLFVRPLDGSWEAPRLVSNADPSPFGTAEQIYIGGDLSWSADGQYLAFTECDYAAGDPENCGAAPYFQAWVASANEGAPALLSDSNPTGNAYAPLVVPEPGGPLAILAALACLATARRGRVREG